MKPILGERNNATKGKLWNIVIYVMKLSLFIIPLTQF